MTIAILGATGAVGREIIGCLGTLRIPVTTLRLLASERSDGATVETPFGALAVEAVTPESFADVDYAFLCAGGDVSREWAPIAMEKGATVIDSSSAFRERADVPLVIPEINGEKAIGAKLIAKPNCTTVIAAMAVYPLYRAFGIKRMIVSTYQSASGAGGKGITELLRETRKVLEEREVTHAVFAHPLPFNIIPHIDSFQENGYTKEEMKLTLETQKIFADPSLLISCTSVRIPVLRVHCETIVLETEKPVTPEEAREVLRRAPGIEIRDDPAHNVYPMPITATGKYDIEVGRIRRNLAFGDHGLELFVAGDQLLKGAALNAVQILQYLLSHSS
ncbi:MAG: aspartate-semialdehyde dehydrogenase [Candidatus Peregrinibacteria bacterium]